MAAKQPVELHVISDSTGETAARLVLALEAQFPDQAFEEIRHPRVELDLERTPSRADEDRLVPECRDVEGRGQPPPLAERADAADDVARRPLRGAAIGQSGPLAAALSGRAAPRRGRSRRRAARPR